VVIGGTSEEVGFEGGVTTEGIHKILAWAMRTAPSLGSWRMGDVWSGFRPFRQKGLFVGPDENVPGLYHATGQHRHGILLAPYVAGKIREAMAQ
jgi:glycine/D-amino acid oxidase-like deaminating enzyme